MINDVNSIGLLLILTIGFGTFLVYSGSLVPRPPANITTFILFTPIKIKVLTIMALSNHFFFIVWNI